jgi:MFS family permease
MGITSLLVFRVIQGMGGGLLFPIQQTVLVQAAGGKQMGQVMSAISLPAALVPTLGLMVGGLILQVANWRWIFYISVPICLADLILGMLYVPSTRASGGKKLDVQGLLLLSPALAAVLYGLSELDRPGDLADPVVLTSLIVGVLLLVAFTIHALRLTEEPLVDLRLFRKRSFSAAAFSCSCPDSRCSARCCCFRCTFNRFRPTPR